MRVQPWMVIMLLSCMIATAYTSHQLRKLSEAQAALSTSLLELVEAQAEKAAGKCI